MLTKYSHLILLVIALGGLWAYGCENRRAGRLEEQKTALEHRNAALEEDAGRIDTVYREATKTLRKVRYATDTIFLSDTVIHTDTVRQIVAQEREKCDAVIQTCEQQKANLRAQVANLDSTIAVLNKQKPGWFKKTTGKLGWVAAGAAAGVILSK